MLPFFVAIFLQSLKSGYMLFSVTGYPDAVSVAVSPFFREIVIKKDTKNNYNHNRFI